MLEHSLKRKQAKIKSPSLAAKDHRGSHLAQLVRKSWFKMAQLALFILTHDAMQAVATSPVCHISAPPEALLFMTEKKAADGSWDPQDTHSTLYFTMGVNRDFQYKFEVTKSCPGDDCDDCKVSYELLMDDQSTNPATTKSNVISSKFPLVWLRHKGNDGLFTVRLSYASKQFWREGLEDTPQNFWVRAWITNDDQKQAEVSFPVVFQRRCDVHGADFSESKRLKLDPVIYTVGDNPTVLDLSHQPDFSRSGYTMADFVKACGTLESAELDVGYASDNTFALKTLGMENFITVDQAARQMAIQVDSDEKVLIDDLNGGVCKLSKSDKKECLMTFYIRLKGLDGYYRSHIQFQLTIRSECYQFFNLPTGVLKTYWKWDQTQQDFYKIRDPPLSFELPHFTVSSLPSKEDFQTRCGKPTYTINSSFPSYYNITNPSETDLLTKGKRLDFDTSDESLVRDKPTYDDEWESSITVKFDVYEAIEAPWRIRFKVSDYCMGWTMSNATITVVNEDSVKEKSLKDDPGMSVTKYVLSEPTIIDFSLLDYTQAVSMLVNDGCGNLVYTPHLLTDKIGAHLVQIKADHSQETGKRFHIDAPNKSFVGNYTFSVEIDSDILITEPRFTYQIGVSILDCYVQRLEKFNQSIKNIVLQLGEEVEIPLQPFEQVPLCNYTATYTATTLAKTSAGSPMVAYVESKDGEMHGVPKLVTIDLKKMAVKFEARDPSLVGKAFQVYITCHVQVKEDIQDPVYDYLPPFEVSITKEIYKPENRGPILYEFNELIQLYPASTQVVSFGKPFDREADQISLNSYTIRNSVGRVESVPWIQFNNQTSSQTLDFTMNPPSSVSDSKYSIQLELLDDNSAQQGRTVYEAIIEVFNDTAFNPEFNQAKVQKQEQKRPVIVKRRKITVQIQAPDETGLLDLAFSTGLTLPRNVSEWSSQNEGRQCLNINYKPTFDSKAILEDQEITQDFSWKVHSIQEIPESGRKRNLNSSSQDVSPVFISVDRLTIKLSWSSPRLVSQNQVKDSVQVVILDDMFEFDRNVRITDQELQQMKYETETPRQISTEEKQMIENVGKATNRFLQVFMSTNIFLSVFMFSLLQFLWGIVNTLQVIMLTLLFSVSFPINGQQIFVAIMKLTNLDIIRTENLLNSIFDFENETPPYNKAFEEAGYESTNFIIELGPIFIIVCASLLFYLIRMILLRVINYPDDQSCTRRLLKRFKTENVVIRFLIESCIEMGLVALISVKSMEQEQFQNFNDGLCIVLAFTALLCLFFTPFYLLYAARQLIWRNFILGEQRRTRYQNLFEGYRIDRFATMSQMAYIFVRRLAMLCILVFLPDYTLTQIITQIYTTLLLVSCTASVQPYQQRITVKIEIFNECTVILACYHLLTFTGWVGDFEMQFQLGWSLIAVVILNVITNFTIVSIIALKDFIKKARIKYVRSQQRKKQMKEQQYKANQFIPVEHAATIENKQVSKMLSAFPVYDACKEQSFNYYDQSNLIELKQRRKSPAAANTILTPYVDSFPLHQFLVDKNGESDLLRIDSNAKTLDKIPIKLSKHVAPDKLNLPSSHQLIGRKKHIYDFEDPYFEQEHPRYMREQTYDIDDPHGSTHFNQLSYTNQGLYPHKQLSQFVPVAQSNDAMPVMNSGHSQAFPNYERFEDPAQELFAKEESKVERPGDSHTIYSPPTINFMLQPHRQIQVEMESFESYMARFNQGPEALAEEQYGDQHLD